MLKKIKQFWKWITGFLIVGIVLAAGTQMFPLGGDISIASAILEKSINGQLTKIEYTDENAGEGLIIRTTQSDFMNFAGNVGLYFSIYNSTVDDQNVKIVFSFGKDYAQRVWEDIGEEQIPIIHPAKLATASTTEVAKYTTYQTKTKWQELLKNSFTSTAIARKDIKGTQSLEENSIFIKSGETKFFKANVKYLTKEREEFFIEAFGDKGSYGMLDPWGYEQKFNTLNTAALDGQDSWVDAYAPTSDIVNVVASGCYEGAKCANVTGGDNGVNTIRTITGVADGTMYISLKQNGGTKGGVFNVHDAVGGGNYWIIKFNAAADGNITLQSTSGTVIIATGYTNDTWYGLKVEFTKANAKAAYCNGTTWSDWSTTVTTTNSAGEYVKLQIYGDGPPMSGVFWIDTITATDPTPCAGGAAEYFSDDDIISDF